MEIYRQPLYYEIAFSFVDARQQVDNFEKIIKKFSGIRVKRFLDIACGPSLQLREIARRGYEAVGLDLNPAMLSHLKRRAKGEGLKIETVNADMCSFRLKKKVDFAFVMMGSLAVASNEKFLAHLDSLATSLKRGGLYFIQNMNFDWTENCRQSWTMKREEIAVRTTYEHRFTDILSQVGVEKITIEVDDRGKRRRFSQQEELKFIFPQEFKALVMLNGRFEFVGWWKGNCNTWHLDQPLEEAKDLSDNMVLLRRR